MDFIDAIKRAAGYEVPSVQEAFRPIWDYQVPSAHNALRPLFNYQVPTATKTFGPILNPQVPTPSNMLSQIIGRGGNQGPSMMAGGRTATGASTDPVQMDQMPPEIARRQMERQLGGPMATSRLDPSQGATRKMATPAIGDDERWSYENNSFADVAQEAARRKQAGENLPGQDADVLAQREAEVFENDPKAKGRLRITGWDTEDVYAVVSRLGNEDYDALEEAVEDPEELLDLAGDTTINALEDATIYMSPELERVFKNGIEDAMNDWYDKQVAARKTVDITSYMMGMTQFALALVGNYQETPAVASGRENPATGYNASVTPQTSQSPAAPQTGQSPAATAQVTFSGPGGLPTEEEFFAGLQQGIFPEEFVQGYVYYTQTNPNGTYDEFIKGGT